LSLSPPRPLDEEPEPPAGSTSSNCWFPKPSPARDHPQLPQYPGEIRSHRRSGSRGLRCASTRSSAVALAAAVVPAAVPIAPGREPPAVRRQTGATPRVHRQDWGTGNERGERDASVARAICGGHRHGRNNTRDVGVVR
jgi:hypothetical protein